MSEIFPQNYKKNDCKQIDMNKFFTKYKDNLIFCIMPLIIFPTIFLISTNEFIIAILITFLSYITILINYRRNEWILLITGIILGLIIEIGGDMVFKAQFWSHGSLFGIPIWLPIAWGYAFIHIRRIGNSIVNGKDEEETKESKTEKKHKKNSNRKRLKKQKDREN